MERPKIDMPEGQFIALFRGATRDILKLDLSDANIRIMPFESNECYKYLEKIFDEPDLHATIANHFVKNGAKKSEYYLFVPIDYNELNHEGMYVGIRDIILIALPCDFSLAGIIGFHQSGLSPSVRSTRDFSDGYIAQYDEKQLLEIDDNNVDDLNFFIRIFFQRYHELEYLKIAILSYIDSYRHYDMKMRFVNLFMAFDALINTQQEVTFRVGRLLAVLNSNTVEQGKTIYKNYTKFYSLRSAIVHGGQVDENIDQFLPMVRALLSRTLIELVVMNFPDKDSMNDVVNSAGFGQKHMLTSEYEELIPDSEVSKLVLAEAPKFKKPKI